MRVRRSISFSRFTWFVWTGAAGRGVHLDAMRCFSVLLFALLALPSPAQTPKPDMKTAASPDGSITFRYGNAGAKAVVVHIDAMAKPLPMTKDATGLWTATTPPLKPEHYIYSFDVDGLEMRDPLEPTAVPNLVSLSSGIFVPGSVPQRWELQAIPHGNVSMHVYTTQIARNLPLNQESYVVYTPPGYDPARPGGYPVLYLLHGWSQSAVGWTATGEAQHILDSLLHTGQIVPMIVVMPQGYGDYKFVTSGFGVWQDPARVDDNVSLFSQMLTGEIIPAVESEYNVARDGGHRAIAGLSMGGLESLTLGLTQPQTFKYVAGMSSAVQGEHFDQKFPSMAAGYAASQAKLKLLWVGCGTEDGLIAANRAFVAWAKGKGVPITAVETPGRHTWLVWRENLIAVAPLLFR